jgi:hypothetical protein
MKKLKEGPIQKWGEKIDWEKRVKAVCKPCWEIKYCPYGPLVESFQVKENPDEKSCRIFAHDCPVFHIAEPLTETKELRNISRSIPRTTQFRVLKRDNQICRDCGKPVKDEDIEFDHIIPWIKGGSSDEHNVKLLCRSCNRKKGKKFEDEYLIESLTDHMREPAPFELLYLLKEFVGLSHTIHKEENRNCTPQDICKLFGKKKVQYEDEVAADLLSDIEIFFVSRKPKDMKKNDFDALKFRWGYIDRTLHKLAESAKKYKLDINNLLSCERLFIQRLGWTIELSAVNKKKWLHF